MKHMTVAEAAKKWNLTPRSVQIHCEKGNVPGATLIGKAWRIPADAVRPGRLAQRQLSAGGLAEP